MENDKQDQEKSPAYKQAEKRVGAKLSFIVHLAIYLVINAVLVYINLSTSPEYYWFKWPLFGWGIGLFFHAAGVLYFLEGTSLKKRMIEKEMDKELARGSNS